ncbi:dynactin [Dendrothele bispora CBS 962.96]|uniref:Dynactin n=1 Tax=Dendrothele bispora (strain CBS 962.96) TaxID=1314807 RepID=A0A4S8LBK7_DENBC|nr:dynactin [Dendrothele bispora CBS 962.96]
MSDYPLGTIVEIGSVGRGVIRFSGPTAFKPGKWIGVELYEPNGKNDGSVEGKQYFTCKMKYGVFVRASQIKGTFGHERDAEQAQPQAGPSTPARTASARPAGHQRTSSNSGLLRANSLRTASPSASSTRSASPAKPPTNGAVATPGASIRASRLGQASPTKKSPSIAIHQPRRSLSLRQPPSLQDTPSSLASSPPNGAPIQQRLASPLAGNSSSPQPSSLHSDSPLSSRQPRTSSPLAPSPIDRPGPRLSDTSQPPPPPPPAVDDTELQELRAKIRVLEAKRADDTQHIRSLETALEDAKAFNAIRPKLQAKLNSLQTELTATRRELSDAQQLSDLAESRVLDAQEQTEMVMLDKEMAEERAESAEAELEEVKEKLAIVEVELEVLKEERELAEGEVTGGGEDGKSSLAYIQLEKQNERLKEALLRLRDMTQENDQEQRRRIAEMEKDINGLDDLQARYEEASIKLSNAEVQIEDLKLQLDDALGAEEMLVQLTERNLMLGEKIEEMRITIEDLESLKELSDELEENHVETEKNLYEDIETRDTQIREQGRKIETLEESCQDYENTITQFRELVVQLQSELETLRTQTQTAQSESANAASQTAQMMYLNLKLQSSASKNQARNIEYEIRKIEARERGELLGIVQPYLPQLYVESDSDATQCYLFFQRLAYKSELINNVVAQTHNLPESLDGPVSETLVGVCDMRGRISGLSTLCKRFAAILRRCDVESFLNVGRIYAEVAPLEKRIDIHIDLLRRDEFRERECVADIAKIQAQFNHLAEMYFSGFQFDLGERELGYMASFDLDLDVFAASIGLAKTSVEGILKEDDVVLDMGGFDIKTELFEPLQKLLERSKSAKSLSKKLTKKLEDLTQDSAALKPVLVPQMETLTNSVQELVNFGISLAQQIMPHLSDARALKSEFKLTTILSYAKELASTTVGVNSKPGTQWWEAVGETITQLIQEGGKLLPSTMENENVLKITGVSPWVTRVDEIKASLAVNLEAERKVAQLNDEIQGLIRSLKAKDQNIQELGVKTELMERRMEAAKKQGDTIVDLENELTKLRKRGQEYEEALDSLNNDIEVLEQENAKLKVANVGQEKQVPGTQQVEAEPAVTEVNLEKFQLAEQIDALRCTVKFLRTENAYLKGHDLLREIQSLPPLPEPIPTPSTPPLDPSGLSDTDSDSESDNLPPTPPTFRSLVTESKILYRDVIRFSSSPKVVDLSELNKKRAEAAGKRVWIPKKKMPAQQVLERKMQVEKLSRRVKGLMDKANAMVIS